MERIISDPVFFISLIVQALTVAWVPTGMKAGVLIFPLCVSIKPDLAKLSFAKTLKANFFNLIKVYKDLKLIILSGSETEPLLFSSPLFILSTNSMPSMTFPKTVYCLSKKGAGLKHIKN